MADVTNAVTVILQGLAGFIPIGQVLASEIPDIVKSFRGRPGAPVDENGDPLSVDAIVKRVAGIDAAVDASVKISDDEIAKAKAEIAADEAAIAAKATADAAAVAEAVARQKAIDDAAAKKAADEASVAAAQSSQA